MICCTSVLHRKKRIVQILLMGMSLSALFLLARLQVNHDREEGTVTNVRIEATDEAIQISWDAPVIGKVDHMAIRVADRDGNICDTVSVKPQNKSYNFSNGEINKAYEVTVSAVYKDGQEELSAKIHQYCKYAKSTSVIIRNRECESIYEVETKHKEELVKDLSSLEGVRSVHFVDSSSTRRI